MIHSALVQPGEQARAEHERAMSSLQRIFPEAEKIRSVSLVLTNFEKQLLMEMDRQKWYSDTLMVLVPVNDDTALGYGVVDNVRGKDQMITYIVTVNPELSVKDLEILAYREPYGGEVGHASWQRQFHGKKPGDILRPGKEIKNISGATISVRSVTYGVRKVLSVLRVVQNRLPHTLGES